MDQPIPDFFRFSLDLDVDFPFGNHKTSSDFWRIAMESFIYSKVDAP